MLDCIGKAVKIYCKRGKAGEMPEQSKLELKKNISFISKKLELTHGESLMFACIFIASGSRPVKPKILAKCMKFSYVQFLKRMGNIETLEERGLIISIKNSTWENAYTVPPNIIKAIRLGTSLVPLRFKDLGADEFFIRTEEIFKSCHNEEISQVFFAKTLQFLLYDNTQLEFCRLLLQYSLYDFELILLLYLGISLVLYGKDSIATNGIRKYSDLFGRDFRFSRIKHDFKTGKGNLFEKGLVEYINDTGLKDTDRIMITQKAREELFAEFDLKSAVGRQKNGIIQCTQLKEKQLYYNKEEAVQVERLASLLDNENYIAIVSRLSQTNMRTGFTCLFSGPPGTGKTETAYQLARATGRDIMPVEIAETKSMWFGQSEKLIKEIFDRYRSRVQHSQKSGEKVPILLFNEADAIICKRKEIGESNLAQTQNAIQNIILEEMEKLEGILIATTNLAQNMDFAFQRRFLYKIDFSRPCLEVRQNIWQGFMPALSPENCGKLALSFDLSGGQIENIARKQAVETVLSGISPGLETVTEFCREESAGNQTIKIGFTAN